jgi:hypothetical protein
MKVEIYETGGFKLVRAAQPIGAGEVVLRLSNSTFLDSPSRESIRVGLGLHADHPVGQFVNHSCQPSCHVVVDEIRALSDLAAGDEITFDYTNNEEALASPFTCLECGKQLTGSPPPCRNRVDGSGHLA